MVLGHHVLDIDMTLITFQDGQPVMRGGNIGTEQECCCNCGCCAFCIESFYDVALFSAGCPEGWTQDFDGICARPRTNVSSCECGNTSLYPIDCTDCVRPDGSPCCQSYCDSYTPGPCQNEFP